ncbi:DUF2220 domain-containing protein [Streptomyces sp. NBC_00102]|nr:DUF2220 domain-containing protein [Streptomyces sp. NBC_00102]
MGRGSSRLRGAPAFAVCGAAEGCDADGIVLVENEDAVQQVCNIPEIVDHWLCIWGAGYATDGLVEFLRTMTSSRLGGSKATVAAASTDTRPCGIAGNRGASGGGWCLTTMMRESASLARRTSPSGTSACHTISGYLPQFLTG